MVDRVILMCAGRAERWGNHLGVHKHLISIDGEMLLDRTLRLIRQNTSAPVSVVAFDTEYDRAGFERYQPKHDRLNFCDIDKFLSSEERWSKSGQTVILYGDVFFSEAAMRKILAHEGTHRFVGRGEWSHYTGCPWREMFAVSFPADEHDLLRGHMLAIRAELMAKTRDKGGGWDLYHRMHGTTWNHFLSIDDFTDDFDFPSDYERWKRRYDNRLHRLIVPVYSPVVKRWRWRLFAWGRRLNGVFSRGTKADAEN